MIQKSPKPLHLLSTLSETLCHDTQGMVPGGWGFAGEFVHDADDRVGGFFFIFIV